ncbi:tRNA (adenosine(37)-N6)-threonylcarbamoyltransferase complex dimerization subunit type 1 TsaB [Thermaurantiacus sp.]
MPDPLTGVSDPPGPAGQRLVIATGHHLSLALLQGDRLLGEVHEEIGRGHAEALMPAIRDLLLGQSPPQSIGVEVGPGSFTGLRVGVAAARALGIAWRVPVFGLSSMGLVAAGAAQRGHRGPLLVALLAPRGQLWIQSFHGLSPVSPAVSLEADAARRLVAEARVPVTGSGAAALGLDAMEVTPRARWGLGLGAEHHLAPTPLYVRPGSTAMAA